MSKAVAALESLVFDLIHKPITKEVVTRVLTHDLLTSETAEQAVDVLYRKEALDADNYYLYLAFYARHGDIQKVKDGIEKANEIYKIPPPTDKWHSSLARAYSAQGRVPDALRHLNAARALNPNHCDVRAHDAVITSLIGRAREIQQELMVYKRNKGGRDRDPNVEFMETESDRRSSELLLLAVDTAKIVQDSGGFVGERTLMNLVLALGTASMHGHALDMIKWATQAGYPVDKSVELDAQFYVYASQSKLNEALEALDNISQPKMKHYLALLTHCGEKGDIEVWRKICANVRLFNRRIRPPFFGKLIDIMGKKGALVEMEELFRELKLLHNMPVSHIIYTSMISIYVNAGNMDRAHQLYLEMRRNQVEPNFVTYMALLRGRLERNELSACDSLLDKAQSAGITAIGVNTIERMIPYWATYPGAMKRCIYWIKSCIPFLRPGVPRNVMFNQMLHALADRGDMNACVELTHEMRVAEIHLCANSYTALFRAAAHTKLDGAYSVLYDGVEKDDVEVTHKLRVTMLAYAVATQDLELATNLVVETHAAIKSPTKGEMDEESKIELLKLMGEVSKLRTKKNANDNNIKEEDNKEGKEDNINDNNTTPIEETNATKASLTNKKNKHR